MSADIVACSPQAGPDRIWDGFSADALEWVEPRLEAIAATPEPDGGVLFIGDSITQGADLASLFPGVTTSNHEVAADTTEGVLARMEMATRGTSDRIVLMIGTNDLGYGGDAIAAIPGNTRRIVDALEAREPQADILVLGMTPREAEWAETVDRINAETRRALSGTSATVLDPGEQMDGADGTLRTELTYDGLHLNAEGYRVWAAQIESCVREGCEDLDPLEPTWLGRTHVDATGARVLGWPGSGLLMRTRGPVALDIAPGDTNAYDVIVDGERRIVQLGGDETRIPLVEGGEHRVELRKRSESFASGLTRITGIDGIVEPVAPPDRRILFIGDSITAGFGTIGADETCPYAVETSSARDAYAAMVAEGLGADYHLVAISGRGAAYNYDDNPMPNMLAQFDLALPDTALGWDHEAWTPDLVVVALGTNDFSTYDPGTTFAANYRALLVRSRAEYPDARIMAVTGPLLTDERAARMVDGIADAVEAVEELAGPITVVPLRLADSGHIWGCNYHPGPDSNRRMAGDLSAAVARLMDWQAR